jgi:cell division septal protein FtsQ
LNHINTKSVIKLRTEISKERKVVDLDVQQEIDSDLVSQTQQSKTPVFKSVFLALLILGGLAIFLAGSDLFMIKSVVVKGNHVIPDETIIMATRIARNQNIFFLNRQQAQRAILANPYIAKAKLSLVLPSRVVIQVMERNPVCLIGWGKTYYLIASDQAVLGVATASDLERLPVVDGVRVKDLQIGKPINAALLEQALTILNNTGRELRPLLCRIDLVQYRLSLKCPGDPDLVTAELGNAERLSEKMANLRAVLAKNQARDTVRIDLRVPEISTVTAAQK